ncbi:hypothetical protein ACGFNX_43680 [Streptomyces sp. NPDC048723]|uniref:hypothetical protein n=1 Tax=Streptomyces sp. NPDC048723 TaxID=3365589 RepID=UPI00371485EC
MRSTRTPVVRCGVAASLGDEPPGAMFVRDAIAARADTPAAMRERVVAGLEPDHPPDEWMLSFGRGTHTCPQRHRSRRP